MKPNFILMILIFLCVGGMFVKDLICVFQFLIKVVELFLKLLIFIKLSFMLFKRIRCYGFILETASLINIFFCLFLAVLVSKSKVFVNW